MNSVKALFCCTALFITLLSSCDTNTVADINTSMPSRNWNYANRVKSSIEIKDVNKLYNVDFRLRHTADYRYSNIFVLLHLQGGGQPKRTIRYEFKLAQPDGQWNGSGSGNLYTYSFRLLSNYKFPVQGKYELEIEQNMRDNPLKEISDAGIRLSTKTE